jgi:PBP1b-binding outer membrane lipoprotein LpoB
MRKAQLLALLCGVAMGTAGCASKHIVRAAPPSVSTPPPEETSPIPQPTVPPAVETTAEPPPETAPPFPSPAPSKRPTPPRPRPAPTETAEPAPPKPAPPQISPQLSAKDLEAAKASTTSNITTAEKNLQLANGKTLSAAQKDLTDKISGFLSQAHDAIRVDEARVLSAELVKSF